MVEPAFGSLREALDALIRHGQPAGPAGRAGEVIFGSNPKDLRGSLLKFKEGQEVEGGGRYGAVRVFKGVHMEGEVAKLRVSLTGSGAAAACKLMSEAELKEKVHSAVIGVLADSRETKSLKGKRVADASGRHDVVLSAVEKEGGFSELCAATTQGAIQYMREVAVETAVSDYGVQWTPWAEEGEAPVRPPAPEHEDLMIKELYVNPEPVEETGEETDEDYGFCGIVSWFQMLVQLGVLGGADHRGVLQSVGHTDLMQLGELCDLAHHLVEHLDGEYDTSTLLQYMAGREEQKVLLEAVLAFGYKLEHAHPRLLPGAAYWAYKVVAKLGPLREGKLPRGTAALHASHIVIEARGYHPDYDEQGNYMPRDEHERRGGFEGATAAVAAARALQGGASPGYRSADGGSRASSPGLGQQARMGFATPS